MSVLELIDRNLFFPIEQKMQPLLEGKYAVTL